MQTSVKPVIADGFLFMRLSCLENGVETECLITPQWGANLCRFVHDGYTFIDFEPDVLQNRSYTGCFLLYPTCNRMRDEKFIWRGTEYAHPHNIPAAYMHGLAWHEVFTVTKAEEGSGRAVLECTLDFTEGDSVRWKAFPFPHRFTVRYVLTPGRIRTEFDIDNTAGQTFPYGLGLHPYFPRLGGDAGTTIEVPANTRMEVTPDLLPTGKLIPVEGIYDLREPKPAENSLDTVYLDRIPGRKSILRYQGVPYEFTLDADESFTHFVVFTPPGKPYFCVENQTSSTDANNMHHRGFVREAHVLEAPAGEHVTAWIEYAAEKVNNR